jgi:hypothetical protein
VACGGNESAEVVLIRLLAFPLIESLPSFDESPLLKALDPPSDSACVDPHAIGDGLFRRVRELFRKPPMLHQVEQDVDVDRVQIENVLAFQNHVGQDAPSGIHERGGPFLLISPKAFLNVSFLRCDWHVLFLRVTT